MSYEKQNFVNGQVLTAEHMNHIEDGIVSSESASTTYVDQKVGEEAQARTTAIGAAIAQEVADRNQAIAVEKNNRENQCNYIQNTSVPSKISAAISDEADARNTAISTAIAQEVQNRNSAIDAAIATEVSDRNSAISDAISDVDDDLELIRGSMLYDEELLSKVVVTGQTVNLFNYRVRLTDNGIHTSTGKPGTSTNFDCSDFILVANRHGESLKAGAYMNGAWDYTCSSTSSWAFYDGNMDMLPNGSGATGLNTGVVIPNDAVYFRFSIRKSSYPLTYMYVVLSTTDDFPDEYVSFLNPVPGEFIEEIGEMKADKDGSYSDLAAGQLLSTTGTANPTPYTYRENASGSDRVTVQQITGGTVAFNQLITNGDFSDGKTGWAFDRCSSAAAEGVCTLTTTADGVSGGFVQIRKTRARTENHVYFSRYDFMVSSTNFTTIKCFNGDTVKFAPDVTNPTANTWYGVRGIFKSAATAPSGTFAIRGSGAIALDDTMSVKNIMFIDLTQMFGATVAQHFLDLETATAGAGVALFRTMFPESYYPYNAGELLSVQTSGRKTVGFNLFDKAAATLGKYYNGSGTLYNNSDRGCSDFIRVTPGVSYYTNASSISNVWLCLFFDSDKQYVNRVGTSTFTAPAGAVYMAINFLLTDIDSLVVNISDPSRDGMYEPYSAHTYPLDSTMTLRGIPVLSGGVPAYDGDKYAPDGTVTRRFKTLVLNGTETWTTGTFPSTSAIRVYTNLPDAAVGSMVVNDQGYDGYYTGQKLGCIRVVNNAGRPILDVYADKNVYADANAWTAHLAESPMTIVYELDTPTTETAAPYQEIQIAGSTEEFLPPETDTRPAAVPVGSMSLYQTNLRAGLETLLNTDLAHAESIAPVQGSTASTNISSGELLMQDGKLYKATQAIVAGAEIGSTNTTETTLAAQLAALEARIAALEN